jgi:S-adenosylmethionine hydrolase
VALAAGEHFFVGPDNGLLWLAAEAAGGVSAAFEISNSPARLEPVSRTFHGRDIFSPVAARLAAGQSGDTLGERIDPGTLVRLDVAQVEVSGDSVIATVLVRDRYGNLTLNVTPDQIERSFLEHGKAVTVQSDPGGGAPGATSEASYVSAFGEVAEGEALLYADSSGSLALAVNRGDASALFGLGPDDRVRLSPA